MDRNRGIVAPQNQGNVPQGGDQTNPNNPFTFSPANQQRSPHQPQIPVHVSPNQPNMEPGGPQHQRDRMIREIMQMQQRMPYIPVEGSQRFPSLLDNFGQQPDPLSFQPINPVRAPLSHQGPLPPFSNIAYHRDPTPGTGIVSLSHSAGRPALVPHDSTSQDDQEVTEINSLKHKTDQGPSVPTSQFQAERIRHASAPDLLATVSQTSSTKKELSHASTSHHSYSREERRRRRLSADQRESHISRHRKRYHNDALTRSDGAVLFRSPPPVNKRKKGRPEPLVIHPSLAATQSRLRSPRIFEGNAGDRVIRDVKKFPPYTSPPILSPLRVGTGLFHALYPRPPSTPLSASLPAAHFTSVHTQPTILEAPSEALQPTVKANVSSPVLDEVPPPIETDILPHINLGPNHQAVLPTLRKSRREALERDDGAQLLWSPRVLDSRFSRQQLDSYMEFACSAAVPGSGSNKEYALHQLFHNKGDLMKSVLCTMKRDVGLDFAKFIRGYHYQDSDTWTTEDIENYTDALMKCDKDFNSITLSFNGRKTHKQCIEFYYLWKKICPEEYKRLSIIRRRKRSDEQYNLRPRGGAEEEAADDDAMSEDDSIPSADESDGDDDDARSRSSVPSSILSAPARPPLVASPGWSCDYPGCGAVFPLRKALATHMAIHNIPHTISSASNRSRDASPARKKPKGEPIPPGSEEFPCKLCGKVFYKVKSRSAHMKSHSVLAKKAREATAAAKAAANQQH